MTEPNFVVGLFDLHQKAQNAVDQLLAAGIPESEISVLMNRGATDTEFHTRSKEASVHHNSAMGVALGGAAGLVLGLIAIATPALSGLVGAGPLALALTGAGVGSIGGGIVGAMNELGVPEQSANLYYEALQRGGTVVAVSDEGLKAEGGLAQVASILTSAGAMAVDEHAGSPQRSGWQNVPSAATEDAPKPSTVPTGGKD